MENISRKPDLFEYAAMHTLAKVNKIRTLNNGVSIGPNSTFIVEMEEVHSENFEDSNKENQVTNNAVTTEDNDVPNLGSFATRALYEMESLRKLNVSEIVNDHIMKLNHIEDELLYKKKENLKLAKQHMLSKTNLKPKKLESSIRSEDLVLTQRMHELIKRYNNAAEHVVLPEVDPKAIEDHEVRLKNERIENLCLLEEKYRIIHEQIVINTMSCKNRSKLVSKCSSELVKIEESNRNLNYIIEKVKLNDIDDKDVEDCKSLLYEIMVLAETIEQHSSEINLEEEQNVVMEHQVTETQEKSEAIQTMGQDSGDQSTQPSSNLNKCIFNECLKLFVRLNNDLTAFTKEVEIFVNNVPSKNFLRKLKIAIITPVNALSSVSALHMRDKYTKISHFLRGNFMLPDIETPNIPRESYFVFVVDCLCKRFISHAEKRFTPSKPEEAFLVGSFVVALWTDYPTFGPVLLAMLMKECPYCIPAYWPRIDGQTDADYYVSLGYHFKNNEIEDEQSFLNRMTGIFMLYVAIIVTVSRRNCPHPYGLENAWRWIAATVNLEPRCNITATFLHTFLELSGYRLSECYGIQFWKIVHLLNQNYVPKIEKITLPDFLGPVSRLKIYLDNVLRGGFKEPKGILTADYWF